MYNKMIVMEGIHIQYFTRLAYLVCMFHLQYIFIDNTMAQKTPRSPWHPHWDSYIHTKGYIYKCKQHYQHAIEDSFFFLSLALISYWGPTSSASLQCIHHRLGLFKLCRETRENNCQTMIIPRKRMLKWGKTEKQTCKQNSEFVSRNRDNSGLCGACCHSLSLQPKLNQWLIYLSQHAGAQCVVDAPRDSIQTSY